MEWLLILTELENSVRLRYRLELGIRWAGEKNINRGSQKNREPERRNRGPGLGAARLCVCPQAREGARCWGSLSKPLT